VNEYSVGFLFSKDRASVLLRLKARGPQFMVGCLTGIGGRVEPGEDFATSMSREFREEVFFQEDGEAERVHHLLPWFRKGTLRGNGYSVAVFSAISPYDLRFFKSTDDEEPLFVVPVVSSTVLLEYGGYPLVFNLSHLIPLCLHSRVFEVWE
jgi:hypothetical protein